MKKASLLASAAIATVAMAAIPAFAQNAPASFADVPGDHWAYGSVEKLRDRGIVIGYPDQTYGGKRAMTRYEFAVAIARLLDQIPTSTAAQAPDLSNYVTKDALQQALGGFASKSDVAELRRLIDEFKPELAALGMRVDRLDQRVNDLEKRVGAIEEALKRVQIGGQINFMARGNHRTSTDIQTPSGTITSDSVVDQNGFAVTGQPRGGILQDTRVLHDLDLNIKARLSETATAEAVVNFGNYLPYLNGVTSFTGVRSDRGGVNFVNQSQDVTVYKLAVNVPVKLFGGSAADFNVGRIPFQTTPYTFKQIDVDAYFHNDKTDLGNIPVDGATLGLKFGGLALTGFAAKTDPIKYVSNAFGRFDPYAYGLFAGAARPWANGGLNGGLSGVNRPLQSPISPDTNGAMYVEQMAGGRVTFGLGKFGTIGGTFIAMSGVPTGAPAPDADDPNFANPGSAARIAEDRAYFDRVNVYGADITGTIGPVLLNGSYTKSDTYGGQVVVRNGQTVIDNDAEKKIGSDNDAWDVNAGVKFGALSLVGGYRQIAPYFAAPGYWGRLGSFTNPTDIKGPYVKLDYALGGNTTIFGEGHFYEGTGDQVAFGGLSEDDKITNFKAGLKFGLTSSSNVDLGVEFTEYEVLDAFGANVGGRTKPQEIFYNIGYGYSFNPSTSIKFLYQIIDYKDKGSGFDLVNGKGGVGAVQFSVKF
jgi:S-layer homology domain.